MGDPVVLDGYQTALPAAGRRGAARRETTGPEPPRHRRSRGVTVPPVCRDRGGQSCTAIAVIPADGVGPEVSAEAERALKAAAARYGFAGADRMVRLGLRPLPGRRAD